ncbi:MAG: hypothetical protein ACJAVI_002357 [Candidatus Azotimanducaceae bacterium]|jgi:hypothetical protein
MSESKPIIIALVVAGLGIIGYLTYSLMQDDPESTVISAPIDIPVQKPVEVIVPEVVEVVVPEPMPIPEPEVVPEPAFILPRLDDSDGLIRDGVVSLTTNKGINNLIRPSELIRKYVVLVDNVANGSIAREAVMTLGPDQPFVAQKISEEVFVMDETSYARYNQLTDVLVSLDSRRAAEFYDLLKPLFQEAYSELGYPDKKFDDAMFGAIGRLLETPVIDEPIRLLQPVVMYEYEDPRLEALGGAQKQLLRMGPRNSRLIQAKLSEMAIELRSILVN